MHNLYFHTRFIPNSVVPPPPLCRGCASDHQRAVGRLHSEASAARGEARRLEAALREARATATTTTALHEAMPGPLHGSTGEIPRGSLDCSVLKTP